MYIQELISKKQAHIYSFSYLGAHRVHHLDVQEHSAERVLELVYAPELPGIDPRPQCLQVRLYPEREGEVKLKDLFSSEL